jgi:hypothetical protein
LSARYGILELKVRRSEVIGNNFIWKLSRSDSFDGVHNGAQEEGNVSILIHIESLSRGLRFCIFALALVRMSWGKKRCELKHEADPVSVVVYAGFQFAVSVSLFFLFLRQ